MITRSVVLSASALAAAGLIAACSSSGGSGSPSSSAAGTTPAAPVTSSASGSGAPAGALFGPGCQSLGLTAANTAPAAQAPVATVAANMPFLSSVVTAANAAGLTQALDAAPAITVFAPVDDAFKKEPPQQVQSLLTDPKMKPVLVATLQYHVLPGRVDKAALDGKHTTLQGGDLTITGSGEDYTINGTAKILCGGIQTKNATVYLIDTVLHPATS